MRKILFALTAALFLTVSISSQALAKEEFLLYSSRFGGVQYIFGSVLAELMNAQSKELLVTNMETSGPNENIRKDAKDPKLLASTLRFALSINYFCAKNGQAPFDRPYDEFKVVFSYGSSVGGTFIVADPKITGVPGLAGKKVGVGERGTAFVNETQYMLKDCFGIWDDVKKEYLAYSAAQDAFMDNMIDAIYAPGNLTNDGQGGVKYNSHPALQSMVALKKGLMILPVTAEDFDRGSEANNWPKFSKFTIPPNAVTSDLPTVPRLGYLLQYITLAHESVPEEIIYQIVKTCAENPDKFRDAHANLGIMSTEVMAWLPVKSEDEIHPGALRYYKEKGIPLLLNGANPDFIK